MRDHKLYLLFGCIIFTFLGSEIEADDYNCTYSTDGPRTLLVKCQRHDNKNAYLPKNLPKNITEMKILSPDDVNYAWIVNAVDSFQKYSELTSLNVEGLLRYSSELDTNKKKELQKKLFDLPKLKSLLLHANNMNSDNHMWTLPKNLEEFYSYYNAYTWYNVETSPNLKILNFYENKLTQMPKFSYPPPPLESLYLPYNPSLLVTVDDIAIFCKLKLFALSVKGNALASAAASCHCKKLKQWMEEFHIEAQFYEEDSWFCVESDCSKYSLDEARKKRQMCTANSFPTTVSPRTTKAEKSSSIFFTVLLVVLISTLGLAILLTLLLFIIQKLRSGNREKGVGKLEEVAEELDSQEEETSEED